MKRLIILLTAASALCHTLTAAPGARDLAPMCDSLETWLQQRTGVKEEFSLTRVRSRSGTLDLYFSAGLSYYPWHSADVGWARSVIDGFIREEDSACRLGRVYTNRYELSDLILPYVGNSGRPSGYSRMIGDPREKDSCALVHRIGAIPFPDGLDGRYIALWQSHGKYYDEASGEWIWQRAPLHHTVEDMLTPGFVLPFLMPMLENAGAYVMTPRERDTQPLEVVCDNDRAFSGFRDSLTRKAGHYYEKGGWDDAGEGFADFKKAYRFCDNPFRAGTARMADCNALADASATWVPEIESRGSYAVYVSYKTLPESTGQARYTVRHMGGETVFTVNQRRGGGTWIYLGTFEFDEGTDGSVTLDNYGPEGKVVTADAVRFGGGMGKLERGGSTSGVASFMEGAHYWMQWAGTDSTITRNWEDDYTNDFATRGLWTTMMREEKQIPFDLSFAFHTDAGIAQGDTTVGTLAIYTLRSDSDREFSDGRDRIISRLLCDYVQTQVVDDIRSGYDSLWSRRGLWDRSYSESRTTGVPAMILELLSHQNFADMKLALDPSFRFTVCRAVYKGILKTLSEFYGCPYVVQPLPVRALRAELSEDGTAVELSWKPRGDSREPTAAPTGYIVYTRTDDGAFDAGVLTSEPHMTMRITPGHLYSYRVEAYNTGGKSFPSETLCVGIPTGEAKGTVLIVNNFTKVSAPAWIDAGEYAGFDSDIDSGVPYISDISYLGETYEFRRGAEFVDNDYPGFGASHITHAGKRIAGNSFDFCRTHGELVMQAGYAFCSMSSEAFCNAEDFRDYDVLDLICGKQGGEKYSVFPAPLQAAVKDFASGGRGIIVSGSNIASDAYDKTSGFLGSVLGIRLASPSGSGLGLVGDKPFCTRFNPDIYRIEHPDAIKPYGRGAEIWMKYPSSHLGAAVRCDKGSYRTVCIAVPIETLLHRSDRLEVMRESLEFLEGGRSR